MTESLRQQMGDAAVKAAQAIHYVGAGTVEFCSTRTALLFYGNEYAPAGGTSGDGINYRARSGGMAVTGGGGNSLPLTQEQLVLHGHALEARIYAEDRITNFCPPPGSWVYLRTPSENKHIRVDTGVREGIYV